MSIQSPPFEGPLFSRFSRAAHGFEAEGQQLNYLFPTFFRTRITLAAFLCSRLALRSLIGDDRIQPISMLGARALIIFGCYEHLQVAEMPAYIEGFVCAPCWVDAPVRPPVVPVMFGSQTFRGYGQWFLHMPVTSEFNRLRGVHLWGLPKTEGSIACDEQAGRRVCRVASQGEQLFELAVPVDGRATRIRDCVTIYGRRGGNLTRALCHVSGTYRVRKAPAVLLGRGGHAGGVLQLASGEAGQKLAALEIDSRPLEQRYSEAAEIVLELPNEP